MNRNPSRDKRKCRLWLCCDRNWWPNSPVCTQSESLDKTTWASLASFLLHDLVHKWGVTTPVLPAMLPRAVPASTSPGHGPVVFDTSQLSLNTARKYWGHRLSVLALGKRWIYNYLGWCLSELYFKKKTWHFSVIFFGSIKRTEFSWLSLYRAFPVQHKHDYYKQREGNRQ